MKEFVSVACTSFFFSFQRALMGRMLSFVGLFLKLRNCENTSTSVTRTFTVTLKTSEREQSGETKKGEKIRFIKMYLKHVLLYILKKIIISK